MSLLDDAKALLPDDLDSVDELVAKAKEVADEHKDKIAAKIEEATPDSLDGLVEKAKDLI